MKVFSIFILIVSCCQSRAFTISRVGKVSQNSLTWRQNPPTLCSTGTAEEAGSELTAVDNVISEMHESNYPFRIVVVGNGAILETTSKLGPVMKSSVSPKTGGRLVTLASEDQSFEFHVKVEEVDNIVFAESVRPLGDGTEKVLRICRFMNGDGGSICSLILGDSGDEAVAWFATMKAKWG